MQILNIQITLLYASNYFLGSSLAYMESLNDLITNLIFNFSHIVFVGSISNSTEGEVVEATKFAKHATKEHLEKQLKDLNKQFATWKPHNHNLVAWTFYQMNNNQHIDLTQNQIMHCIICHHQIVGLEILALLIITQEGFIAYHKSMP